MRAVRRLVLVAGILGGSLLGATACSEGEDSATIQRLTDRVIRLEAWQAQQKELMRLSHEHAVSLGKTLEKQEKALALLSSILQDVIKKAK